MSSHVPGSAHSFTWCQHPALTRPSSCSSLTWGRGQGGLGDLYVPLPHVFNPLKRETAQSICGSQAPGAHAERRWHKGRLRASSPYPDKPGAPSVLHLLLEPPSAQRPSTWGMRSKAHLADS